MVKIQNIYQGIPDHKKNLYVDDAVMSPEVELEGDEKYLYKQKEITPTDVSEETLGGREEVHFVLTITNKRILVRPEKGQKMVDEEYYKEIYFPEIRKMYYGTKPNRKKIKLELKNGKIIELPKCTHKKWQMKQISKFANLEKTEWGTSKTKSITKKIVGTIGATGSIVLGLIFILISIIMMLTVVGICLAIGGFFAGGLLIWVGVKMGEHGFRAKKEWVKKTSSVDSTSLPSSNKQEKKLEEGSKKRPSIESPPSAQESDKDSSGSKYCKYCGTEINIDSKFCKECGKKVVNDDE